MPSRSLKVLLADLTVAGFQNREKIAETLRRIAG